MHLRYAVTRKFHVNNCADDFNNIASTHDVFLIALIFFIRRNGSHPGFRNCVNYNRVCEALLQK
jgi:hypothetical protein